jgi:organic hydroperoxide reductase OsmC/OhrA
LGKRVISQLIIKWSGAAAGILNKLTLAPSRSSSRTNGISVPAINGTGPEKQGQFPSPDLESQMLVSNISSCIAINLETFANKHVINFHTSLLIYNTVMNVHELFILFHDVSKDFFGLV